jgi:hypothetical protein
MWAFGGSQSGTPCLDLFMRNKIAAIGNRPA